MECTVHFDSETSRFEELQRNESKNESRDEPKQIVVAFPKPHLLTRFTRKAGGGGIRFQDLNI